MDLYREEILDHYKHPHNRGVLDHASHQAQGNNPLCGDEVTIQIQMTNDKIQNVAFEGQGCAISVASASLVTDAIKGKSAEEISQMNEQTVTKLLGVEPAASRMKCAMLGLTTVQQALQQAT